MIYQNKKRDKKAQTSVITMVILIIVGIVAVSILGSMVFSMIKSSLEARDVNPEIIIVEDTTFYNSVSGSAANSGCIEGCLDKLKVYVKLKRGSNTDILDSLRFVFVGDGKSIIYWAPVIPKELEERIYYFELTGFKTLDSVKIAPVVLIKGDKKGLDVISQADLKLDNSRGLPDINNVEACNRILETLDKLPPYPIEECIK